MAETLLIILMVGTLCIACFLVGAKVGQKVTKGEPIELPNVNPIKAVREREDRKKAQAEQDKVDAILKNIENYDGHGHNQVDVPR